MINACAGIVTYNPNIERLKENIDSVVEQVKCTFVVDNNSTNKERIERLVSLYTNVYLIRNDSNYGIAHALNQLCEAAVDVGMEWILTLDQDTVCPHKMLLAMSEYTSDERIAIICPGVDFQVNTKKSENFETEYVSACMTSASLTRLLAWRRVGGFREDYFIDFVDNEFCMKLSIAGYRIVRINTSVISHQLGEEYIYKLFGVVKLKYFKHSDLRYYYMTRNNSVFIKEYKQYLNVPKEICKLVYIIMGAVLFSNGKKRTLKYIKRGFKDARINRLGVLKDSI